MVRVMARGWTAIAKRVAFFDDSKRQRRLGIVAASFRVSSPSLVAGVGALATVRAILVVRNLVVPQNRMGLEPHILDMFVCLLKKYHDT